MPMKKQTNKKQEIMINIEFFNRQRKIKLPADTKKLVFDAIDASLKTESFDHDAEVSVTFVSDAKIKEINNDFRGIAKSTDVLSFPLGESGIYDKNPENGFFMLGDIIISIDHAIAQAELFGHSIEREIAYLTVHSMFHLLGYDHMDEGPEKKLMRSKEEAALSLIGLEIL